MLEGFDWYANRKKCYAGLTPTLPFLNLVLDLPIDMLKLCYSRREEQLKSR